MRGLAGLAVAVTMAISACPPSLTAPAEAPDLRSSFGSQSFELPTSDSVPADESSQSGKKRISSAAIEESIVVTVNERTSIDGGNESTAAVRYREKHVPQVLCGTLGRRPINVLCADDTESVAVARRCEDGSPSTDLLLRQRINDDPTAPEAAWSQAGPGDCPALAEPEVTVSAEEFRTLPLAPSVPSFQPVNGRGLVNMELIVFTDPAEQVLQTTVLGTPVTVRATPSSFSWDFGDGSAPLVTSDPGAPYPALRVFHVYEQPGSYQVQLTTTWTGLFQVDGQGPWFPVTGTAQTVSPAFAETVVEARSHLVDAPLP